MKQTQALYGKGIVSLYDMERLYHFIYKRLTKFTATLAMLSAEKQLFETILRNYKSSLYQVIQAVAHG